MSFESLGDDVGSGVKSSDKHPSAKEADVQSKMAELVGGNRKWLSCVLNPKRRSQSTAVKQAIAQPDRFDIASGGSTASGKNNKSTKAGVGAKSGDRVMYAKWKTAKKPRTEACDAASPQEAAGAPPEKETAESDEVPGPTQFWFGSQTAAASNVKG